MLKVQYVHVHCTCDRFGDTLKNYTHQYYTLMYATCTVYTVHTYMQVLLLSKPAWFTKQYYDIFVTHYPTHS